MTPHPLDLDTAQRVPRTDPIEPTALGTVDRTSDDPGSPWVEPPPTHPGQMRLARIQVHNWGTFDGGHDLPVPRDGLLLTGESGSGKSSILDAISAVLMKPGETRFNAAAQDGPAGDRDRTPMTYVRGAYRKHTDDETGEVRPGYLRPAATVSGIALTFGDGLGTRVTAIRVSHVAGASTSAADLRTAYLLFDRDIALADVLKLCLKGIDRRRLKRALDPQVAEDTYTKFGVRLRRDTGMGSEAAQRLLHRTQSAKSLTSLDALLRDFMLDVPPTFALADQAVEHFRALQDAHATVVDAREQVETLRPQREIWRVHLTASAQRDQAVQLKDSIDTFRYTLLADLAEQDLERMQVEAEAARHMAERAERAEAEAMDAQQESARALHTQGGADLHLLDRDRREAEERIERIERERSRIRPVLERLDAPMPVNAGELAAAHVLARREQEGIAQAKEDQFTASGPTHAAYLAARDRIAALEAEIRSLSTRRSNLPAGLIEVRDQLATASGEPPASLPFAGELMDVRDPAWQGAAERLLHGLAISILVPDRLYGVVSRAVESRHWGTRVSYERVRRIDDLNEGPNARSEHTVSSVLQLAESPLRPWLRRRLAQSFPHVLVDDATDLARHERALTREGQIKNRDSHIKDDRFRIGDRSRWVIGTDNAPLVEWTRVQIQRARADAQTHERALAAVKKQQQELEERSRDLEALLDTAWGALDLESPRGELQSIQERTERLLANADLAQRRAHHDAATASVHAARSERERTRDAYRDAASASATVETDLAEARQQLASRARDGREPLPATHRSALEARMRGQRRVTRANLPDAILSLGNDLNTEFNEAERTIRTSEADLASARAQYLARWRERSVNLVDAIDATEDFLTILSRLEADRLPEFENRFRELLRTQSQNNMGQLRAVIGQAIRNVHRRLLPVNDSLRATWFDTERRTRLRLKEQQRHSGEVKDFLGELLAITQGAFGQTEETITDAEARFARMDALLRRLGSTEPADLSWRRRVLDTRLHVEFVAEEVDAAGEVLDIYRGSDGRSGGQRQRLVTFCLAAALRYQLTDAAEGVPPYGLVVLDEAFDKTDIHFTRAGLEVFRSFRFQLLLATPLKMLQTIEEYVGGAAVVSKSAGNTSTVAAATFIAEADAGGGQTGTTR